MTVPHVISRVRFCGEADRGRVVSLILLVGAPLLGRTYLWSAVEANRRQTSATCELYCLSHSCLDGGNRFNAT